MPGAEKDTGRRGGSKESLLRSYGVILCKAVSTPSGDQVDDPSKKPGRTDPRKARQDKPNYANDNPAIIYLAEPGDK